MSDKPGRRRTARKAAAKKKTATKKVATRAATKKAAAKKTAVKKAPAKKAAAPATPKRVIAERPPQRSEPQRGSLRDRLHTASVAGAGSGEAEAISRPAPATTTTATTGPRNGSVAILTGSRRGNLKRDLTDAGRVFTGPIAPAGERDDRKPDTGLGDVIGRRNTQAITAEVLKRTEAARINDVKMGLLATEAELKLLRRERERLAERADAEKLALIDDYIQLATAEAESNRTVLAYVDRARDQKGRVTLIGRVADADGQPQVEAQVYFVDSSDKTVSEIPPAKPDSEGVVWIALNDEQTKAVIKRGGQLSARAQLDGKEVAADPFAARIRKGSVYQFDLGIRDGKPDDRTGGEGRARVVPRRR